MAIQTATADEDLYGELLALVEAKKAKYLGERYDDRGIKQIAVDVRVDAIPNEQIRIGREFFTTALRDYEDWREKWFRECVQNSVDGGATRIDISVEVRSDGVIVSCEDNGRGMDREVLLNKFLVLGGTTKVGAGGSTGGFGKAKELLVLPWLSWSVHTRDAIVDGSGIEYEVRNASFLDGTKITVVMPPDQCTSAAAAEAFIEKCNILGVKFTVNGKSVQAKLRSGEEIADFDGKAKLFHNRKAESDYSVLLVRANGLYMFYLWVTAGVPGTLILELTRPSIELLSANRDGFRDVGLKRSVQEFVNQLAKDTSSALKKKKGIVREKYRGSGKFEVTQRDLESTILENEGALLPETKTLSDEQVGKIADVLDYVEKEADERQSWGMSSDELASPPELVLRANGDIARAMLDDLRMGGTTQLEAAIAQLSWTPDFYLINDIEDFKVPPTLRPERMAVRTRQLLTYWAELCRFVLIQLGSKKRYGVGFVISETTAAAHVHEDGEDWLVLNPFKKRPQPKRQPWEEKIEGEFYSLSDKDDLAWLYAAAVHECTHIADGIIYHDESFSTALTVNVAKTSGKLKQLGAIRKAVTKRSEKKGAVREAAVPASPRGKGKAKELVFDEPHHWHVTKITKDGVEVASEGIFEGRSKAEVLKKVAELYGYKSYDELLSKPWNEEIAWTAELHE